MDYPNLFSYLGGEKVIISDGLSRTIRETILEKEGKNCLVIQDMGVI